MLLVSEEIFQDISKSLIDLNAKYAALLQNVKQDNWISQDEACTISGLEPRQLWYQAEQGKIRWTKIKGKTRGRMYSRYDAEQLRLSRQDDKGGCS